MGGDRFKIVHGEQSMGGLMFSKEGFVLDVEVYNKTAENISYATNVRFNANTTFSTADQQTYGADFFCKERNWRKPESVGGLFVFQNQNHFRLCPLKDVLFQV